jgi:hypothetical protein
MNPRQPRYVTALPQPLQQHRNDHLALAADAVVGVQVSQRGLGEDAVAGPAHDELGRAGGPAGGHHVPHRLQEELGLLHRLVVDVADRQGDDLGLELANCRA